MSDQEQAEEERNKTDWKKICNRQRSGSEETFMLVSCTIIPSASSEWQFFLQSGHLRS